MHLNGFFKLALFTPLLCLQATAATSDLEGWLTAPLLAPDQTQREVQEYAAKRIPSLPRVFNARDWERDSARMRQEAIDRVMLAGRGLRWREAASKVEWQDVIQASDYRIRKLRFEVAPGMWVPALLYEPAHSPAKHPGVLYFNGHDPAGKAAPFTQTFCLNLVKRGASVLCVEWFGTGQLAQPGFAHGRLNQLDLVGTSGIAPFHLTTTRALGILLEAPEVDPARIAAVGFDGGGWQALLLGALDPRVSLVASVAGYGSLFTALQNPTDLRDAEYLPADLCTVGDYAHFTLMLSPRPVFLSYNAKDPVCFPSDRTLSPLVRFVAAFNDMAKTPTNLQFFINERATEHTFDRTTRERCYQVLGRAFAQTQPAWADGEIACDNELRPADQLAVPMPATNETFHSLAERMMAKLPLEPDVPRRSSRLGRWQEERRFVLRDTIRAKDYLFEAKAGARNEAGGTTAHRWTLQLGSDWTVPLVDLSRGKPKATAILLADRGRATAAADVERLLNSGLRVLAVDVFGFGEAKPGQGEVAYPLLIAALGDRPLGVQAGQVSAVARWAEGQFGTGPVVVAAMGPRTSLIALLAAGLEENAIGGVELHNDWPSLKHLITADLTVDQAPEAFCPRLLEEFDVPQLEGLVQPRPIVRQPAK